MKTCLPALALALAVLALSASPRVSAAPPLFRPPQTAAEKAMDEILRTSLAHPELFFIVLQNPAYDLSKTKEYEPLFTAEFLSAWRKHERELVIKYCAGKYIPGKSCGYDANPVQCNERFPMTPPFLYRTVMVDHQEAYISVVPTTNKENVRHYYLRHEIGRWRLGGLACDTGDPNIVPWKRLIDKFRQPKFESEKKLEEIFRLTRRDKDSIPFVFDLEWRDRAKDRRFFGLFTPAFLRSTKERARALLEHVCFGEYVETGKGWCEFYEGPVACDVGEDWIRFERTTMEEYDSAVIVYVNPETAYSYPEPPGRGPRFEYHLKRDAIGWKLDGLSCGDMLSGLNANLP